MLLIPTPPFSTKFTHGSPSSASRHLGDLGNIVADSSGAAAVDLTDRHLGLHPASPHGVAGLAFVVHAGEDDLGLGGDGGSLATGNAGGRIACGGVQLVKDGEGLEVRRAHVDLPGEEAPRVILSQVGPGGHVQFRVEGDKQGEEEIRLTVAEDCESEVLIL